MRLEDLIFHMMAWFVNFIVVIMSELCCQYLLQPLDQTQTQLNVFQYWSSMQVYAQSAGDECGCCHSRQYENMLPHNSLAYRYFHAHYPMSESPYCRIPGILLLPSRPARFLCKLPPLSLPHQTDCSGSQLLPYSTTHSFTNILILYQLIPPPISHSLFFLIQSAGYYQALNFGLSPLARIIEVVQKSVKWFKNGYIYWIQQQYQMKADSPALFTCVLLCTFLALAYADLKLDVNKTVIQSNSQWSRVQLGINGGVEPYQLYYDEYPQGWSQVINYVYIPATQRQLNRKYPCKVRVVDEAGTQLKATIILSISSEKVYVLNSLFSYDETFDDSFFDSGIYKGRPTLVKANGTANNAALNDNTDFQAQSDNIDKINSVSEAPGAGIINMLSALTTANSSDSVTLGNVQASVQLKDQLKGNNAASSSFSPDKPVTNIQSAAAAINPAGSGLAVLQDQTLTADQKQLVLISNIKSNEISQTSQQRSIESIFSRLPGPQEIDTIILTSDSFALVKTIQKVIQSDLTCEQKISYLSDFFGRIQSAISLKAFTATQLSIVVEGAQAEIKRINNEIDRDRQSIAKLGLEELRNKLNTALVQLQDSYGKFNEVDTQIAPKQALIASLNKDSQSQRSKANSIRQELPIQKLQLNEITATIAKLEEQYREALDKRAGYDTNIQKLTSSVSTYDTVIKQDQDKIDSLEIQISKGGDTAQRLKNTYQALEVSIQRQRTEISTREKTQIEITALLPNLQQRADIEKKKMNLTEAVKVRDLVKNLQTILPNITKQADDVNYKCNQLKQVEVTTQNNIISYAVPATSYTAYIQSSYQIKPETSNIKSGQNKISITPTCILDNSWNTAYGNPYTPSSFLQANEFTFKEDFNCLGPSSLQSGSGMIKNVNKKYLEVDIGGRTQRLNLGACSRIQSPTPVPKVGQKIYFRAQKIDKNQFNLYKGSCI